MELNVLKKGAECRILDQHIFTSFAFYFKTFGILENVSTFYEQRSKIW